MENLATDMDRAYDDDELVCRCDGCGGVLEPRDAEPPVIYDCFHVLHAGCAHGRDDACPRCQTPRRVHDDDGPPEPVDEVRAPASPPPDNNPDEDSALASDGMGNDDDSPGGGESPAPASMSGSGCNHASSLGCCACRVAELEGRLEEKSAALTETTNALEVELVRARIRLGGLEKMYDMLEKEADRNRGRRHGKEEAAERRNKERLSSFPQDQTD